MPGIQDIENINLVSYDVRFKHQDLGLTTVGSLQINVGGQYVDVDDADQLEGIIKSWEKGFRPMVRMTLKRADFDMLNGIIMEGRSRAIIDGAKRAYTLGSIINDLIANAGPLWLHPSGVPLDQKNADIYFYLANAKVADTQLLGSRDNPQELAIEFTIFPDLTRPNYDVFGRFGDWSAVENANVLGVAVTLGTRALVPVKHLNEISVDPDFKGDAEVYALHGAPYSPAQTVAIDNLAGYTATAKAIQFDGLTSAGIIVAGTRLLSAGGEVMYVQSVNYNVGQTSGTMTVVRAENGTTAAALIDNQVLNLLDPATVGVTKDTLVATYTSDTPANWTFGDSLIDAGDDRKARIAAIGTGVSSAGRATVGGVDSPDITVTIS